MSAYEPPTATAAGLLCGRAAELVELRAALAGAASGRGRFLALTGEPGIGKTRLAEAAADLARDAGATVLWGPCWEGGGAPAYWPWVQALRALARQAGDAPFADHHRPYLGRLAADLAGPGAGPPADIDLSSESERFALFDAVATSLRSAAEDRPLVVVLDDLHAADRASVLLLDFAARVLVDAGVVLLATWREAEAAEREDLAPVLAGLARVGRTLPLRGLDREDLAAFVAARGDASDELVTAVHLATDGNPFYVDEVLRLLAAEGRLEAPGPLARLPLPDGVRDAIARRLAPLPDDVRELLAVASVIGREFRVETLAGAAGLDAGDVVVLLDRGTAHGAVEEARDRLGRFRFRHALVMEVLYDGLSATRRAMLHRAVGETLERTYAGALEPHVAELAHHFVHASPPGDAAKAIDYARRAGARALRVLAYEEAVTFLARAVRLLDLVEPDGALRAELLLELGRAQTRSGDAEAARGSLVACTQVAREAGLPRRFCEAALELGAVGLPAGIVDDEVIALLEEGLGLLDPQPSPLRARLLGRLAVALYWEPSSGGRRTVLAAEAERMARLVGDPQTLATVLGQVHLAVMGVTSSEDEERLAELEALVAATGDRELEGLLRLWWVINAVQRGRLAEARSRMRAFGVLARKLHQPRLLWYAALYDAVIAQMDGRWEDADRCRQEAIEVGSRIQGSFAVSQIAANLFVDRWLQGDVGPLAAAADALAEQLPLVVTWRGAAAVAHAHAGNAERVRPELRALAATPDVGLRRRDVLWLVGLALLADAALQADVPELGVALVPLLEEEAAAGRHVWLASSAYLGPTSRFLGLARLAAGDAQGAVEALETALEDLRAQGVAGWLPVSEADLARARAALDDAAAAPGRGVLRREGDIWAFALHDRTVRLRDARGLQYLATLLSRPGEEVHALELVGGGAATAADMGLPVLDDAARDAYRARIADLREELDEAERFHDPVRAERARDELEALTAQLAGAVGLGGRARTTGDDAERARVNATRAIRASLRKVAEQDAALGAELEATVRTGTACAHVPGAVRWTVAL